MRSSDCEPISCILWNILDEDHETRLDDHVMEERNLKFEQLEELVKMALGYDKEKDKIVHFFNEKLGNLTDNLS